MFVKVAIGAIILALAGGAYIYSAYGAIARGGSGYAAKNICSGYFLSGFSPETMKQEAIKGVSEPLANVSHTLDLDNQLVTTRLYGMFERRAIFTPGIGCTLLPAGEKKADMEVTPLPRLTVSQTLPWPKGGASPDVSGRFDDILEQAFTETDANKLRYTKAVVVAHEGRLIAEKYAEGVKVDTPLIGWSMTKSVTALMVGILVKDGTIDIDAPAQVPLWHREDADPRAQISLDHLLRMSSGLEFDETYEAATDVTEMLSIEPDTAAFAADKPMIGAPDTIWSYSSGTTNIVSAIIKRSVGDTLQDYYTFSQNRLFRPLSIKTATLESDRNGVFVGSSYLYASARDWARLGQLCLQNGEWEEEQILPDGWIEYVTTPTPTSSGNEYGAHFWLNRDPENSAARRAFPKLPDDTFYMEGVHGQLVLVIPSEDLVIARLGFSPHGNHGVEALASQIVTRLNDERNAE